MAVWQDLPVELIIAIAEELQTAEDRLKLATTCHHLHKTLNHIAYREITIERPYSFDKITDDSFRRFVRSILLNPALADCVRVLDLDFDPEYDYWARPRWFNRSMDPTELGSLYSEQPRSDIADDIRLFVDVLQKRGLPNGLANACGSWGQLLLLLHHLPNLASLVVLASDDVQCLGYAAVGKLQGGVPAGLRSLRSISLRYANGEGVFSTASVVPFMVLPALEALNVVNFLDDELISSYDEDMIMVNPAYRGAQKVFTLACSSIQELRLAESSVGPELLQDILGYIQELRVFEYSVEFPSNQQVDGMPINQYTMFPEILEYLAPHRHCLQSLLISHAWESTTTSIYVDLSKNNLLRQFTNLTILRVPVIALVGLPPAMKPKSLSLPIFPIDILPLPQSLSRIEMDLSSEPIAKWDPGFLTEVLGLTALSIPSSLSSTPNLREIVIRQKQRTLDERLGIIPDYENIKTRLQDRGVQIRLENV